MSPPTTGAGLWVHFSVCFSLPPALPKAGGQANLEPAALTWNNTAHLGSPGPGILAGLRTVVPSRNQPGRHLST